MKDVTEILEALKNGEIEIAEAEAQLKGFEDIGHSRVDLRRADRNGSPEVILGQNKTAGQIVDIMQSMSSRSQNVLATRIEQEVATKVQAHFPAAIYHELPRLLSLELNPVLKIEQKIAVVCAGTSDLPVAEEARITAEFYGNPVEKVYDAGVAGIHRLFASLERIRACRIVVVVAGMEGALPSVVGGLVDAPVIAVPTSVGYGANFGGLSALLTMLNSCASGVSVVNIDNGFGAGYLANRMNRI
ncbi:MAG: nickel pincer cofactor biosynthesis protein LarB [Verrucomicrobiota bacterium]